MASVITFLPRIVWLMPEGQVLTSLVIVGVAGILAGLFLRVPAILAATMVAIAFAIVTSIYGNATLAGTLLSVALHAGVLQAAYLATSVAASLWVRSKARDR